MIFSKAKFIAWLNTKHPRTKAGVSCDQDFCPLAKFLTQTTGTHYIVDGDEYGPAKKTEYGFEMDSEKAQSLPQWAREFISAVDDQDGASVSVGRALTIVENSNIGRGRVNQF